MQANELLRARSYFSILDTNISCTVMHNQRKNGRLELTKYKLDLIQNYIEIHLMQANEQHGSHLVLNTDISCALMQSNDEC